LQKNGNEAQKMAVKAERQKKIVQENTKSKSKMSKAEKKAAKKLKAQEFQILSRKN
jgi:hypothetical protein